jgi:Fe2+ or Zn2+ uptake regulation protein
MSLDLHATADERLRGTGQRYTDRRRQLVGLLAEQGPLSIPQILEARTDLKQSSVYRNLSDLEQAGVVHRVATDEEHGRYELAEDLIGHHHHLICSSCGLVEDVTIPGGLETTIERSLDRLAARAGFARVRHRLDLIGTCRACREASATG